MCAFTEDTGINGITLAETCTDIKIADIHLIEIFITVIDVNVRRRYKLISLILDGEVERNTLFRINRIRRRCKAADNQVSKSCYRYRFYT